MMLKRSPLPRDKVHRVFIPGLVPQVYGSKSIDPSLVQLGQESIWLDAQRPKPSIDPGMLVLMLREISLMACVRATYPQHFVWWHWPALRHVKYFSIMFLSTGLRRFPELGSNAVPGPVDSPEHHIWFFCCELLCSRLCLLYTSPSPRDKRQSRMPSSA